MTEFGNGGQSESWVNQGGLVPATFRIVQPEGHEEVRSFADFPVIVGRAVECGIMLADTNVSRNHAKIDQDEEGRISIQDCGSLNGIRVNGDLAQSRMLRAGDVISLGDSTVEFMGRIDDSTVVLPRDERIESSESGVQRILEVIQSIDTDEFTEDRDTAPFNVIAGEDTEMSDPALQETVSKLHRAYSNLLGIMKFVAGIGNEPNIDSICSEFIAALRHVYPLLESVVVVERRPEAGRGFRVLHEEGADATDVNHSKVSRTILLRIMEEGRALYAVDAARDPRFDGSESVARHGVRSMMCAPLVTRGNVVGAIYIDNRSQPYCFNYFDLNLLTVFAFFLGNALEVAHSQSEREEEYEKALEVSRSAKKDKMMMVLQYSQSERKFRALFEQSALGAAIISLNEEVIEEVNDGLVRMLGYSRQQLARRTFQDLLMPEDQTRIEGWIAAVKVNNEGSFKIRLKTLAGDTIVALMSCRMVRMAEEPVVVAYFIDITDKERAEKETHLQLQRVTALSELSQALMSTLDQESIFRALYEKICDVLPTDYFLVGLEQEETATVQPEFFAAGSAIGDELATEIWETVLDDAEVNDAVRRRRTLICDWTARPFRFLEKLVVPPNGDVLRSAIFLPIASRGFVQGVLCVQSIQSRAYDIGHLEILRGFVAQAALALSNAQAFAAYREQEENLHRLNIQIMTAQETERARISRELHDGIGQQLTAMKYLLESVRTSAKANDQKKLDKCIGEARSLATLIIEDLRAISLDLRPTMLDDLGLKPTLDWFLGQFASRHEINLDMDLQIEDGDAIAPEISTATYRIIQEALGNVAKHSEAKKIRVAVFLRDKSLHIEVDDDGVGFPLSTLQEKQISRGCSGVLNMKERARFLGGSFSLDSSTGEGTQLRVSIPVEK
ncbi:MAG: GAF domain-containing protein [Candidatus Sumerlaeia bacterium]|nr:GAF domain-containing protein [Candidatus Sumerlaeia bacterium]